MAVDAIKLKSLARLFAPYAPLYAVGGYVRDGMLGYECSDIDICSSLTVAEVKSALAGSEFSVLDKSLRMGTVLISCCGFKAEYTTFRTESYDRSSGAHAPEQVEFTTDIAADARRRDFTCNAVYSEIMTGNTVDPTGGVGDIKCRILRAADEPDRVFGADGLRVLRLVRFACELGFDADGDTYAAAKRNAWRVKDIAPERVRDELNRIFVSDTCAKNHAARRECVKSENGIDIDINSPIIKPAQKPHMRGIRMLDDLGLVDMVLPELAELKGLEQPRKYHLHNAYEHSLRAFEAAPSNIRWAALLHDIGKRRAYEISGGANMHGHDAIGAEIACEVLNRLKFSNAEKDRTVALIRYHMTDLKGDMSWHKLRRFAAEHSDIADDLCALKDADAYASCGRYAERNRLREAWEEIKSDGTPLSVKELKVNGNDLLSLGIEERHIGEILHGLFIETVLNPDMNDRQSAINYVIRKSDSFRKVGK